MMIPWGLWLICERFSWINFNLLQPFCHQLCLSWSLPTQLYSCFSLCMCLNHHFTLLQACLKLFGWIVIFHNPHQASLTSSIDSLLKYCGLDFFLLFWKIFQNLGDCCVMLFESSFHTLVFITVKQIQISSLIVNKANICFNLSVDFHSVCL